jgi:hypothetical protein
MPELKFQIEGAEPAPFAMSPHLLFKLRVVDRAAGEPTAIHSVALRCQIRIEPTQRRYGAEEQSRLFELFGQPRDWPRTVHSMLWTHVTLNVPRFSAETVVDLPVPCVYDFNIAATKYFAGLEEGEVPLCFLFSGTVFYEADGGGLRIAQISWEEEASYRLPANVWRKMMQAYYPNSVWICLPKEIYQRVDDYKRTCALTSWDAALEKLLGEESVLGTEGGR